MGNLDANSYGQKMPVGYALINPSAVLRAPGHAECLEDGLAPGDVSEKWPSSSSASIAIAPWYPQLVVVFSHIPDQLP